MWKPLVFWLTLASHALITLSYFIIPFSLILLIYLRKDFKFRWLFVLFGAFILLCGLTHLLALITLYKPIYGVSSLILFATAIVSVLTSIVIWPQIPILAKVATPWQLEEKNLELQRSNEQLIKAEKTARSIIEAAPDAMIMVNDIGDIILANNRAELLFGFTQTELTGESFDILLPERFHFNKSNEEKRLITEGLFKEFEDGLDLIAKSKSNREFPVEISICPIVFDDHIVGLASIRDVTSKKRTERRLEYAEKLASLNSKLEQQKKALIKSNDELNNFSYIAAHDLREPLRGIQNYAEFLLEDYGDCVDDEGKKMLTTLPRLAKHLDSLIDSLLQYSRLGYVDLAYAQTDVKELVESALTSLEATLDIENCIVTISEKLPPRSCDKVRITEVFYNLISNAIKYNESKEKIIEVGFDTDKQAFYVKDNGIGVDFEFRDDIFKIFKRLHAKDKYGGGSGSGLTLIKKIIERHQGNIWHEPNEPGGSYFYFTLPG